MRSKEFGTCATPMGLQRRLLLGGTAFSLATGQAGAQVAQNAPAAIGARVGAPMTFADLAARLQPAVVNISTKQRVPVRTPGRPFEEFFRRFGVPAHRPRRQADRVGPGAAHPRDRLARLGLHHFARRLHRHQQPPDPGRDRQRDGRPGHRHPDRPQGISGAHRRPRHRIGPRAAQDRRDRTCPSCSWGDIDARPRRRLGARDRQSVRPRRHRHGRHHLRAPPRNHRRRRLRPLHPDRRVASTWAIRAARCSTSTAMSSASTRR